MKTMMKPWSHIAIGLVLWLMTLGQGIAAPDGENTPPAGPVAAPGQAAPDMPAPMTDIHDIHPPVPVGFDAPWLMPVLLTLAGVVILAALIWWWWRRRRKQQTVETIVPELPPEMIANKALSDISDVRGQDGKTFYFRLSAILRQYIGGRFGVGAPEMTTEEFLPCIARLPVDRELARQLKQLCRAMDPVKFGGVTIMEQQMETDLLFVRGFVRRTTPEAEMDEKVEKEENSKKQIPNLK
ncbi:hypothetical protein Dvar_04760 [Desulfosarcina variabilis str. Montpellier]|uniref:DUF4381 family protein n=1 Tax=Desulfosarcina variabilis TaxID=2300 RepID=UPI003AFACBBF